MLSKDTLWLGEVEINAANPSNAAKSYTSLPYEVLILLFSIAVLLPPMLVRDSSAAFRTRFQFVAIADGVRVGLLLDVHEQRSHIRQLRSFVNGEATR